MSVRTLSAVVLIAALPLTGSPSVTAADPPADSQYLTAAAWPKEPRFGAWKAAKAYRSLNDTYNFPLCEEQPWPRDTTGRHSYFAAKRINAFAIDGMQYVAATADPAAAKALSGAFQARLASCVKKYDAGPDEETRLVRVGHYRVGDGLTVFKRLFRFTGHFKSRGYDLYGVGRSGRYVTVVELSVHEKPAHMPVKGFTKTATSAVRALGR